jgi:hypothetical protein
MLTAVKPVNVVKNVVPGSFEPHHHWYPKALNATIHPMVYFFFSMDQERIINRYCHLHPRVKADTLREVLQYRTKNFHWCGADLLNVTSAGGKRQMVVIENNSCPSGQKSMPLLDDNQEQGSYRWLIERSFLPFVKRRGGIKGCLAVIHDKNPMEASGYAAVMADVFQEEVLLVEWYENKETDRLRIIDGVIEVKHPQTDQWIPVRAAFRYLTQKPWNRLPVNTKTRVFNPVIACLAGGRNKMMAAKAYESFNYTFHHSGLKVNTPETIRDVPKRDIPKWVEKMGGQAVVKVPYSNAGQGVFTIISREELDHFMELDFAYDRFIVQSLIGNINWSSISSQGRLYHVGTIPTSKGKTYVADLRMMVSATDKGIRPLSIYARRAKAPLEDHIQQGADSWEMLGTNLSINLGQGKWDSDTNRLLLMDRRDFNKLGVGLDDLIEAYIQTVLSMVAIDQLSTQLIGKQGKFKIRTFSKLNDDPALLDEIVQ